VTVAFVLPSALCSVRVHVHVRSGILPGRDRPELRSRSSNAAPNPNTNSEPKTWKRERLYYRSVVCLALDTSTPGGSCAIARHGHVIRERRGDPDRPPDTRLPRDVMRLLADTSVDLSHVDLYAVATGPGSFTGLRIGIATMQGLAFAAGKPLLGVSGFDALMRTVRDLRPAGRSQAALATPAIATWVDAWRGEVFAARYEHGVEVEPPSVEKPAALLARISSPTIFVGDAVPLHADMIRRTCAERALFAEPAAPILAGMIARIATETAAGGCRPAPDEIRPLYIRRPDAELARDARPVR